MTSDFLEHVMKSKNKYLIEFVQKNEVRSAEALHDALMRQKTKLGKKLGTTRDTSISEELFKIQEVFDSFPKIFS